LRQNLGLEEVKIGTLKKPSSSAVVEQIEEFKQKSQTEHVASNQIITEESKH